MPQIAKLITSLEQELELRIEWLEKGLKEIANGRDDMNPIYVKQQAQSILDGEPTTADKYNDDENTVLISDINKEIAIEWNREREKRINKEKEK
jgi:hypothetical protein